MGLLFRSAHSEPFIGATYRFFLADAVSFLKLSDQLVALAVNLIQIILRQLTPFFLERTFHLLPLSCDLIPIH